MTRLIPIGWAAALFVLLTLLSSRASAEGDVPAGYSLVVDSEPASAISFERLAAMLAADLGAPVTASGGRVALTVRYRDRKLTVRADHGQGRVLERTIDVEEATAEREASLLASNMARDEARELLDGLAARAPVAKTNDGERAPAPAARPRPEEPNVYASAALFYPVATNLGQPNAHSYFDFSLLYGRVGYVHGAQIGSFVSYASREANGVQLTAFGSITKDLRGAQISGFGSVATNEAHGFQTAGAFAYANEIDGTQAAPFNVARYVNGLQIGAINIAQKVKGAQIGAINIAEDVDGVQLGAINISRDSIHPIGYASNLSFWNAGIKFQTKYVYVMTAFTYGTLETKYDNLAVTYALGGRIPLDDVLPVTGFDVQPEANIVSVIPRTSNDVDNNLWLGGRAMVGYSFARHLRVFAGGGARFPLIVNLGREVTRPEVLAGVQF